MENEARKTSDTERICMSERSERVMRDADVDETSSQILRDEDLARDMNKDCALDCM